LPELKKLEFFLLRYVPNAVREEFANIGLLMFDANGQEFIDLRFTKDWRRVLCMDAEADIEMMQAMERDLRGQLQTASDRDLLLRRIAESFSNLVQLSPMKGCLAAEPAKELDLMAELYLAKPKAGVRAKVAGRQLILAGMRNAFEKANVMPLLMRDISVAQYTRQGDPFHFDFGYRVGETIKLFHAVSLKASVEQAITLAARYPKIAKSMPLSSALTAVVDDDLAKDDERIQFALASLEEEKIQIAPVAEMPQLAEAARRELRA